MKERSGHNETGGKKRAVSAFLHRLMMMMQTSGGDEDAFLAGVRTQRLAREGSRQDPKVMRQKKSFCTFLKHSRVFFKDPSELVGDPRTGPLCAMKNL